PGESHLPSAHQSAAVWAAFDHCDATPDTSAPPRDLVQGGFRDDLPDAETTTTRGIGVRACGEAPPDAQTPTPRWRGCRGVELWTMRGAGHVPHPRQPMWGRTIY